MSQGTPASAFTKALLSLFSSNEADVQWVDIIAELGRRLSSAVMPQITLKTLRQQLWIKHDDHRYELGVGDKMRLVGSDQDVYEEQGLYVAQEMTKTDAGAYVVHFIGILRNGCWVRGFITFDPVIYKGCDFTFDIQEGGALFIERTTVAQLLSYWEWKPQRVVQKLVYETSLLIRDKEDRMKRLQEDFKPLEQLGQILGLKFGFF